MCQLILLDSDNPVQSSLIALDCHDLRRLVGTLEIFKYNTSGWFYSWPIMLGIHKQEISWDI